MNITNATINAVSRTDVGIQLSGQSSTAGAATVNIYNNGQYNGNTKAGNNGGNHLQISRSEPAIVNVYPGGLLSSTVESTLSIANQNVAGNIRLVPDSGSQATLNVLGGTVLAGVGASGTPGVWSPALTKVTLFDAAPSANATSRAIINMTGGSITAYTLAISQPGNFTTNPTNGVNITGGTLYLGAANITYPAGGTGTNFFFNLSGGTVSAIQNWSPASVAPINLTNVNGNITFQAADSTGAPFSMGFSGALKGIGGFNKTGGGILTLSGANNYSGATVVNNGTLTVSTLNLPVGGALTLEGASVAAGLPVNSVVVASSGQSWTIGSLTYDTGTPTADFNYGSFGPSSTVPAIQVNGNLAFNVTPIVTVEGSSIALGTYPLIKYTGTLSGTPPTTVTFTGSASAGYVTNITATQTIALVVTTSSHINGLVWSVGSGNWDASTPNWAGGMTYANPDSVSFDNTASGPFPITVTNIITASPSSILVSSTNNYTITGPGVIAGGGNVTKTGSGALTLLGTNTYSGGTTIALGGGTLNINYGGDGANNSAIGTGPLTLNTGAKLDNTSGHAVTLATPITQYWNDDWTYVGTTNLNLGTAPVTLGNGQVVLTVLSNILEADGQISDGGLNYGMSKQGAGTLTLSNYNSFAGGMEVDAGILNINNDGAVGTGVLTLTANGAIDNTSGSLVTLSSVQPSAIALKGCTFLGTTNLDLGTAQINVQTGILTVSNNTLFVEGALNGASTTITKNGPGAVTIGGSQNSGSVAWIINAGIVNLNRSYPFQAVGAGQSITINSNAQLVILNPSGTEFNVSTLNLGGGVVEWNGDNETLANVTINSGILRDSNPTAAQLSLAAAGYLTLGGVADFDITNGATLTINGTVAGTATNGVLLKTGAGTLILTTNTTYVGNTTVSNGVLSLIYDATLATNSIVTIADGAKLDLSFTNTVNATNIVGALVLHGTNAAAGLHNASTDPAYITGTGSLMVVPLITINPMPGTIQFGVLGNTLTLAWPTNAGWLLQAQTNSLQTGLGTNWVTMLGSASITNLSVPENPANGSTFYRLIHP
jgi:autotransporter-associated beta strand protein